MIGGYPWTCRTLDKKFRSASIHSLQKWFTDVAIKWISADLPGLAGRIVITELEAKPLAL